VHNVAQILLEHGACDGVALAYACRNEMLEIAIPLMEGEAPLNVTEEDSMTPFMNASNRGQVNLVKLLIEKSAKLDERNVCHRESCASPIANGLCWQQAIQQQRENKC